MPDGELTYRRGQIRCCQLDPTGGNAAPKICESLVVQNDVMNQYGRLTLVIPLRPGSKKAPYVVNVAATAENGLDGDRFLDVAQIRAVDGQRVLNLVGVLEAEYWLPIRRALDIVLGFDL